MEKNGISERIFQVRSDVGLSQQEFGGKIGVTGRYITMLEKGTKNASEGLLLAMCYRFKVNEKWLKNGGYSKQVPAR